MALFQRTLTTAIAATALAGALTVPAWAQVPAQQPGVTVSAPAPHHPHAGKHHGPRHAGHDVAKFHAERSERLKTLLQLQPNQQAAWDKYVQATTPTPRAQATGQRPDLRKLSTPERLDLAQQLRKQRTAQAEQREQATRSFYSNLNASQQKAFDALTSPHAGKRKAGKAGHRMERHHKAHPGHDAEGHRHPAGHRTGTATPAA